MAETRTPKQKAFCLEYLKDRNATQAAIRAGYAKNSARQQGQRLLSKDDIQNFIDENLQEVKSKALITREMIIEGLLKEAKFSKNPGATRVTAWKALSEEFDKLDGGVTDKAAPNTYIFNIDTKKPKLITPESSEDDRTGT